MGAEVKQRPLAIHQVVDCRDLIAGGKQVLAKNTAQVTRSAGDEYACWHGDLQSSRHTPCAVRHGTRSVPATINAVGAPRRGRHRVAGSWSAPPAAASGPTWHT